MLGLGTKHTTNTYCEINNTIQHEMIKTNVGDLKSKSSIDKIATDNHCLQNTYWLSKINKTAIKARFIVIYRKSSIKPLATLHQHFNFFINRFTAGVNTIWVVQFNRTTIDIINKLNKRNKAKSISAFDFSTLYTK